MMVRVCSVREPINHTTENRVGAAVWYVLRDESHQLVSRYEKSNR